MLFGDRYNPADLRLVTRAVAHASLRSIHGFRASTGAQHRLAALTGLAHLPSATLVGDRDRLTPLPCTESITAACRPPGGPCARRRHLLMLERPGVVNTALGGVLGQVLDDRGVPSCG